MVPAIKKRRLSSAANLALIMGKSHEVSHYLSQVCQNLKIKTPFQVVEDPLPVCRVHGGMTRVTVWEPIFCVDRKFWQGLETLSSIFSGPSIFLRETYSHQNPPYRFTKEKSAWIVLLTIEHTSNLFSYYAILLWKEYNFFN